MLMVDLKEKKHSDLEEENFDSDLEEENIDSDLKETKHWFRFRGGMKWCDSDKCNKVWIDSS